MENPIIIALPLLTLSSPFTEHLSQHWESCISEQGRGFINLTGMAVKSWLRTRTGHSMVGVGGDLVMRTIAAKVGEVPVTALIISKRF